MKRIFICLLSALLLASCSSHQSSMLQTTMVPAASSGDFKMSLTLDPSPPAKGNEMITVSLKDASENAVKGATVTSTSNMPAMSMSGPALAFQNNGDGTYSAVTNLNYSTKWIFRISASHGRKSGKAEFSVDVP